MGTPIKTIIGITRLVYKTGKEVRTACHCGQWRKPTSGLAYGYVQANLVVLHKDWAWDFLVFAQRNPKPCPILEVGEIGKFTTRFIANSADIRTDLPKYRIYRYGNLDIECDNVIRYWDDKLVFFLVGCSFSFEESLLEAGLEVRNITENVNVPMYITNIKCPGAGKFPDCSMVVSMRPFSTEDAHTAARITREYPGIHGEPVHIGDPTAIGIKDINKPDFGDAVIFKAGEIPVFWACGVTTQIAAITAKPPLMITHAPGHMFVSDKLNREYQI